MHVHIEDVLPFTSWLRRYNRHYLKADLFAGLTVAVVALPQSMAYAIIAGLPVEYGLYASIVPTIIGCLWGSSAHLITGPTTTASLVVFSALSSIAQPGSPPYIELAFLLAAHRAGVTTVVFPSKNEANLREIPEEIQNDLEIVTIDELNDVVDQVLK
jgi:SulP family sulfate permease